MKKYTEYIVEAKNNRVVFVTDPHVCHIEYYSKTSGLDTLARMDHLTKTLTKEHERAKFDCILALGDYSLDFWSIECGGSYLMDPPVCNTEKFVKLMEGKLPEKMFMIPGNHEPYSNEDWMRITGYPREFVVVYGEYVFVMLDTFAGELDPKYNHDGVYTGINTELLRAVLADHPDKKIVLCVHDLLIDNESDEARELIRGEKRIVCAFAGHTHRDNIMLLPPEWRSLPVFYCGDFSFAFGRNNKRNWGFLTLSIPDGKFSAEYVPAPVEVKKPAQN